MRRRSKTSVATRTFVCFGGQCTVVVAGSGPLGSPQDATTSAGDLLLGWHEAFTRFKPTSELSKLNADPREEVAVSPMMARFVQAVVDAADATGGLVDATLLEEIEEAGYRQDRLRGSLALAMQLALAPERKVGGPHPSARWREITVDGGTVRRPPGVKLDGGGLVKGLFADAVAEQLAEHAAFAVDCAGDSRVGGSAGRERAVAVPNPFDSKMLHEFVLRDGAIASSDISLRSWLDRGRPVHHLLDPATGQAAYTGVVHATALAPTALEGEALAKAAILSGPDRATNWLRHGGVAVFDDGSHTAVEAS